VHATTQLLSPHKARGQHARPELCRVLQSAGNCARDGMVLDWGKFGACMHLAPSTGSFQAWFSTHRMHSPGFTTSQSLGSNGSKCRPVTLCGEACGEKLVNAHHHPPWCPLTHARLASTLVEKGVWWGGRLLVGGGAMRGVRVVVGARETCMPLLVWRGPWLSLSPISTNSAHLGAMCCCYYKLITKALLLHEALLEASRRKGACRALQAASVGTACWGWRCWPSWLIS